MKTIAAIDVGSNAIRLIIGKVNGGGKVHIVKKFRQALRLGTDVFKAGKISDKSMALAVDTFDQFRKILDNCNVAKSKAVATSAVREAQNSKQFIQTLAQKTQIALDVIDYKEEARLIHLAVTKALDTTKKTAVIMDIGGGSVELILSANNKIQKIESFELGTVRTLSSSKNEREVHEQVNRFRSGFRKFIDSAKTPVDMCIGTGGNIECMLSLRDQILSGDGEDNPTLSLDEVAAIVQTLVGMPYQDRISKLKLRPDRADVIVPAIYTTQMLLGEAKVNELHIPQVGLKEGLLHDIAATTSN